MPFPCTPRVKNAAATRKAMLAAARARFLDESYDNVGLREIAGDVGVDVALVSRYFGNKETLFKEVLRAGEEAKLPDGISPAELPSYLATTIMHQDCEEGREQVERLLIILRSASSPKASEIVRGALREDILAPFSALLSGRNTELRANLAVAVWMGTTILRRMMAVGPLCQVDRGAVERKLVQLFEAALAEVEESADPVIAAVAG